MHHLGQYSPLESQLLGLFYGGTEANSRMRMRGLQHHRYEGIPTLHKYFVEQLARGTRTCAFHAKPCTAVQMSVDMCSMNEHENHRTGKFSFPCMLHMCTLHKREK
jgi:hypothetical protein